GVLGGAGVGTADPATARRVPCLACRRWDNQGERCLPPGGVALMSEPRWYYARDRRKVGPVPLTELRRLLAEGELRPDDMVLQEGQRQWLPASALPDLSPARATVVAVVS